MKKNAAVLKKGDFDFPEWLTVTDLSAEKCCLEYYKLFFQCAEQTPPGPTRDVYRLLGNLCSLVLSRDADPKEPFEPLLTSVDGRSAALDDFRLAELEALVTFAGSIEDPELRARVTDVHWVLSGFKSVNSAHVAIEAYLAALQLSLAKGLGSPGDNVHFAHNLLRCSHLSRQTNSLDPVRRFLTDALIKVQDDSYLLSNHIGSMLICGHPECELSLTLVETKALSSEAEKSWNDALTYWDLLRQLATALKKPELRLKAQLASAEVHVQESLTSQSRSSMVAAHHLTTAITALRRIGGQNSRVKELQKDLLALQAASMAELLPIEGKMDGSELCGRAQAAIGKALDLREAFLALTQLLYFDFPHEERLREFCETQSEKFVLSKLMPTVRMASNGRVVARQEGGWETSESDLKAKTFEHSVIHFQLIAQATICPAANQIWSSFRPGLHDVWKIVENSPFVPEGRSLIFSRALHLGLKGEFDLAAHLLVPQLENSLRHLLTQAGHISSRLTKDCIQDEYLLNQFLYKDEIVEVLGARLVFVLKALLTERWGYNFRRAHSRFNAEFSSKAGT